MTYTARQCLFHFCFVFFLVRPMNKQFLNCQSLSADRPRGKNKEEILF